MEEAERMDPLAATLVRMIFAGMGILPLLAISRYRERSTQTWKRIYPLVGTRRSGLGFAVAGSVAGPFLGVWASLIAVDLAPLGIAQTLCSLTPIFILPTVAILHKERVSLRAVAGALVAVIGAALLFVTST